MALRLSLLGLKRSRFCGRFLRWSATTQPDFSRWSSQSDHRPVLRGAQSGDQWPEGHLETAEDLPLGFVTYLDGQQILTPLRKRY